jgi:hypothetical protein
MTRQTFIVVWVCALCACLAVQAQEGQTLAGFSVPEYDREGNMTSQLFGDYAEFMPGGEVKITNLKIEFYEDNEVDMRVMAPACKYFEKDKQAESDGDVRIARGNMVVTGTGFKWNARDEKLEIYNDSKVVLKNLRKHMKSGEEEE